MDAATDMYRFVIRDMLRECKGAKIVTGYMVFTHTKPLVLKSGYMPPYLHVPEGSVCFERTPLYGVWEPVAVEWSPGMTGPQHVVCGIEAHDGSLVVVDASNLQFDHIPHHEKHVQFWVPLCEMPFKFQF